MKTSEVFKMIDEVQAVEKLWKERYNDAYDNIKQQKKALEAQLEELKNTDILVLLEAEKPEIFELANKASEKLIAHFKTTDNDKIKKAISFFERGIITNLELMHDIYGTIFEESYIAPGKGLAEIDF